MGGVWARDYPFCSCRTYRPRTLPEVTSEAAIFTMQICALTLPNSMNVWFLKFIYSTEQLMCRWTATCIATDPEQGMADDGNVELTFPRLSVTLIGLYKCCNFVCVSVPCSPFPLFHMASDDKDWKDETLEFFPTCDWSYIAWPCFQFCTDR